MHNASLLRAPTEEAYWWLIAGRLHRQYPCRITVILIKMLPVWTSPHQYSSARQMLRTDVKNLIIKKLIRRFWGEIRMRPLSTENSVDHTRSYIRNSSLAKSKRFLTSVALLLLCEYTPSETLPVRQCDHLPKFKAKEAMYS